MYDVNSKCADDFINHEEILDTLAYADENKENIELIDSIIEKAKNRKGLSHREASVLLACPVEEKNQEIYKLAEQIKKDFYGNRIVMFAPLYLSNYCINGCTYCPYHAKNKHIPRKQLSQEDIRREVIALQDMGHKRLALEAGEDPVRNTMDYYLKSIETIYSIKHKNGAIRRVNINIAATTVDNYRLLKEAGIGTYILFQETYHKESYLELHPTGPKHDYNYHTEAMDRAMEGGIDDVGLGVLFGLDKYRYEFAGLLMHAEHLEAAFGVGPHTISVPRLKHADDINPDDFDNGIDDDTFANVDQYIADHGDGGDFMGPPSQEPNQTKDVCDLAGTAEKPSCNRRRLPFSSQETPPAADFTEPQIGEVRNIISPNTLKKAVCEQNSVPLHEKKKARKRNTNKGAGQPAPSTIRA